MICDICQGKVYPRQCRNDAAKRRAWGAPDVCPHGIALNNLPIGDNAPVGLPACEHRRPHPGRACCVVCLRDEPIRRVVKRAECVSCLQG